MMTGRAERGVLTLLALAALVHSHVPPLLIAFDPITFTKYF